MSVSGVRMVERGIRNFLRHAGCLAVDASASEDQTPMRIMEVKNRRYFVLAADAGLFEPAVELGDWAKEGQLCGEVHFVDDPKRKPAPAHFRATGMVICKRRFGRVERGDCVAHLATDWKG